MNKAKWTIFKISVNGQQAHKRICSKFINCEENANGNSMEILSPLVRLLSPSHRENKGDEGDTTVRWQLVQPL